MGPGTRLSPVTEGWLSWLSENQARGSGGCRRHWVRNTDRKTAEQLHTGCILGGRGWGALPGTLVQQSRCGMWGAAGPGCGEGKSTGVTKD